MWIYATYNRPKECRNIFEQILKVGCTTPGILIVQGTEMRDAYTEQLKILERLPSWRYITLPENIGLCQAMNLGYSMFPQEPWYGSISDDEFVFTPKWDEVLPKAAGDWFISHGDNHWQSAFRCHGYITWGGELIRTVGYIYPKDMWHWYGDDVWEYIAKECKLRKWCQQIQIEDRHYLAGKAAYDNTYRMAESRKENDQKVYAEWRSQEAIQIVQRIKEKTEALTRVCYDFRKGGVNG